jgi:predicted DNA-binding transcriptional regulator YafY
MRRTDRLFDLLLILRDGRLHRAQDLADRLEVSLRTIYRDMDTLIASGVPIAGERGLGYMATAAITLPPLNLSLTELEALHLGMSIVGEAADDELRAAARSLSAKIDAVLPEDRRTPPTGWGFAVYPFADAARGFQHMPAIRGAIRARQKLRITYRNDRAEMTDRVIRPLQIEYWGRVWTATCWCELRNDFRVFRVDRIDSLRVLPQLFIEEPGKTLADYLAAHGAGGAGGQ